MLVVGRARTVAVALELLLLIEPCPVCRVVPADRILLLWHDQLDQSGLFGVDDVFDPHGPLRVPRHPMQGQRGSAHDPIVRLEVVVARLREELLQRHHLFRERRFRRCVFGAEGDVVAADCGVPSLAAGGGGTSSEADSGIDKGSAVELVLDRGQGRIDPILDEVVLPAVLGQRCRGDDSPGGHGMGIGVVLVERAGELLEQLAGRLVALPLQQDLPSDAIGRVAGA